MITNHLPNCEFCVIYTMYSVILENFLYVSQNIFGALGENATK